MNFDDLPCFAAVSWPSGIYSYSAVLFTSQPTVPLPAPRRFPRVLASHLLCPTSFSKFTFADAASTWWQVCPSDSASHRQVSQTTFISVAWYEVKIRFQSCGHLATEFLAKETYFNTNWEYDHSWLSFVQEHSLKCVSII